MTTLDLSGIITRVCSDLKSRFDARYQATLRDGIDIKKIGSKSLLGSGNLSMSDIGAATAAHNHGSISSLGTITGEAVIESGDKLAIADSSASLGLKRSSIAFGSSTSTFLANNGTWQTPTDTKNTAGSTNNASKLYLIGATSQDTNPQTYSQAAVYAQSGNLYASTINGVTISYGDANGLSLQCGYSSLTVEPNKYYNLAEACEYGVDDSIVSGTTSGNLTTAEAVADYVDTAVSGYLPLSGGTLTDRLTVHANNTRLVTIQDDGLDSVNGISADAYRRQIQMRDANGKDFGWIQTHQNAAGTQWGVSIGTSNADDSAQNQMMLSYSNGSPVVWLSQAGAWRSALGLGSLATKSSVAATTDITGQLPVANGGTGASTAADARTNLDVPGLSTANTFTANQIVQNANQYIKLSGVDSSKSNNDVSETAYQSFGILDKDSRYLLFVQGLALTDGSVRAEFSARNYGTGSNINNMVRLTVNNDGTKEVYVSDPAGWRSALALDTWTTVSQYNYLTVSSGWVINTFNCQYNAALGAVRLYIQVGATTAQTAGQKTLFTVKTAYRPKTFQASVSSLTSNAQAGQVYTNGNFAVNIVAISVGTNLYFNGVYFIGA